MLTAISVAAESAENLGWLNKVAAPGEDATRWVRSGAPHLQT
jgi:hypothetical protein